MAPAQQPKFIVNWHNEDFARRVVSCEHADWAGQFENTRPIDLEIGIGNGSFLIPFLKDNPDRNMVGIEIEPLYLKKADRKLQNAGIDNGRLLIGDAKLLVWRLFSEDCLSDVYINYPDPWFKKRHVKRRLVNPDFLKMLATRMTGVLTVVTDDADYKDFVLESVRNAGCFAWEFDEGYVNTLPGYYETKYELKWKSQGKVSFYMRFRRQESPLLDENAYAGSQHLRFVLEKMSRRFSLVSREEEEIR